MKKLKKTNTHTKIKILTTSFFVFIVTFSLLHLIQNKTPKVYISRGVIEYAEMLVREKKPAPTESARVYAYVSTGFYDALVETKNTKTAESVARYFAENLLNATNTVNVTDTVNLESFKKLKDRSENDGYKNIEYEKPQGESVWIDRDQNPKTPFTPNAGKWKRWIVTDTNFDIPEPPVFGSYEYKKELEIVRNVSENRTAEQSAIINFFGGVPGTNQPAGIWIDLFFETTKKENMTEEEFAYRQMILSQTLADAFIECWKVKYTYWTKRPDMVGKNIQTAMDNPPFPSYVSGHSTISAAAATVLANFFPKKKDFYIENAENARDSRLWAGIHFNYDNMQGYELGKKIGEEIISKIK